jgi:hypothetical protein
MSTIIIGPSGRKIRTIDSRLMSLPDPLLGVGTGPNAGTFIISMAHWRLIGHKLGYHSKAWYSKDIMFLSVTGAMSTCRPSGDCSLLVGYTSRVAWSFSKVVGSEGHPPCVEAMNVEAMKK